MCLPVNSPRPPRHRCLDPYPGDSERRDGSRCGFLSPGHLGASHHEDSWPQHPSSDPRRIHNGPSHPISPHLPLPCAQDSPDGYPSFSSPATPPGTTDSEPYRGWANLANAGLLGDGPDFRDVAKRVSELGPARFEHRALRRREEVVRPRLHGDP